uniref:Cytosine specific methyltransferase n=1 Tax=Siphoviridae sp. ctkkB9 TaxID=2825644 RepID=A0A8S5TZF1_9CAUD|nr:MAG TPA: Cytosine specific methyltransferase [Siphoviridae sp. ctkkB9]
MNKKPMTLGSLFDGSGGFPLGGLISGITPLWASEVEPFPIRVTSKRIPQMKHLGDISTINGAEIEPVDIITFGSPCQDMSVAGKRSGLDGERSCLFYEAIRIVKEMRCKTNGQYPRYIVWENVPGAFSSNAGEDFKAVLEAVASVKGDYAVPCPPKGKWTGAGEILGDDFSIAWRCVDAQFWGVPQRRRRIYLVADFNGGCAGKILFESEGLFGNLEPSRCPWKRTAGTSEESTPATGIVLNDQGGSRMDVTEEFTCPLRAEAHHPPCVMESAGFCTEHSADSRGIGYEAEKSPTLRAGVVPATVYENHSQDTRYVGPLDVAQTVAATYGTGGNNQPFVVECPKTLKIRSGCEGGGKGALIQDNLSATLCCNNDQTLFIPKAYGICSKDSNAMKSPNPNSGFYKADTSRTLDGNGGNPTCNQGGIAIVEGNGSRPSHHGNGYAESDVMYTLNTVDRHAVVYAIDRESYNCGQNFARNMGISDEGVNSTLKATGPDAVAVPTYSSSKASFFISAEEELANTLVATDYKDPPLVNDTDGDLEYIVRRLTPTECARLQGFPDWWCADLGVKLPSEEELTRWAEIFETHRKIVGTSSKPKTRKQIFKWLQNPHSDSAEYKMWGNGVALPNVVYVLTGIVYYTQNEGV